MHVVQSALLLYSSVVCLSVRPSVCKLTLMYAGQWSYKFRYFGDLVQGNIHKLVRVHHMLADYNRLYTCELQLLCVPARRRWPSACVSAALELISFHLHRRVCRHHRHSWRPTALTVLSSAATRTVQAETNWRWTVGAFRDCRSVTSSWWRNRPGAFRTSPQPARRAFHQQHHARR